MSRATAPLADPGADSGRIAGAPLALAHTDWLRHLLTVSGPAAEVGRFRAAARGTSAIPWHLDLDHEEARLYAPMASLGPEARTLARELREVIAARHDRVLARWAEPGVCPLDLHRLIPVPDAILSWCEPMGRFGWGSGAGEFFVQFNIDTGRSLRVRFGAGGVGSCRMRSRAARAATPAWCRVPISTIISTSG